MPNMTIHLSESDTTVAVTTDDVDEICHLVRLYLSDDRGPIAITLDNDDSYEGTFVAGTRVPALETGIATVPDSDTDRYWRAEMRWERRHQAERDYDDITCVSCPFCHATTARPCVMRSGKVYKRPYVHADRRASWHRLSDVAATKALPAWMDDVVPTDRKRPTTKAEGKAYRKELAEWESANAEWINKPITLDEMKDFDS